MDPSCGLLISRIFLCISILFLGAFFVVYYSQFTNLEYKKIIAYAYMYTKHIGSKPETYKLTYRFKVNGVWETWEGDEVYLYKFIKIGTPCILWYNEDFGIMENKFKGQCAGVALGAILMLVALFCLFYSVCDFISLGFVSVILAIIF